MSWTRSDKLAFAGVLVAVIGVVAALLALRQPEVPKLTDKTPIATPAAPPTSVRTPTRIGFSESFSISENSTFPSKTGAKVETGKIGAYWGGPPQAEIGAAAQGPVFGKSILSKNEGLSIMGVADCGDLRVTITDITGAGDGPQVSKEQKEVKHQVSGFITGKCEN